MADFFTIRRDALAISSLSLALLMTGLDSSITGTSLPELARSYHVPFASARWIVLSYLLAATALTVAAGRAGDVFGRRRVFLAGMATFTLASFICAIAPSLSWIVIARATQGAAAAATMALSYALIGDLHTVRPERAMGRLAAMSAIGTTVGPILSGVAGHFSPHAIFLVNVPLGVLAFVLAVRYLPATRGCARGSAPFDTAGTAILAISLLAYTLAMARGSQWQPFNTFLVAVALCGAIAFVAVELRASSPLVRIAVFRDAAFSANLVSSALVAAVVMATLIVGPVYLTHALGLGRAQAAVILSAGPAAAALTGSMAGRFVERLGISRAAVIGLSVMASGAALLSLLPSAMAIAGYVVPLAVMTAGYAAFQTANNAAAFAHAGAAGRGVVAGLLTLSRNFGQITGTALLGTVFLRASAATDLVAAGPAGIERGMRTTLGIATALVLAALALIALTRTRAQVPSDSLAQPHLLNAGRTLPC